MNPFLLNKYKGPEYFCDREIESKEIISALDNGRSITLFADRRLGKTALIHHILAHLDKRKRSRPITAYIDIFDTMDEFTFVKKFVGEVITSIENKDRNIFDVARKYFSQIKPKLAFDPITNLPEISFDIQSTQEVNLTLSTLFKYLKDQKKPIIIAIDEFQQINEYKDSRIAATLRSHIQSTPNVHYIFSGSKKHILLNMFSSPNQPFYSSTQLYPLKKIEHEIYKTFIAKQFQKGNKSITVKHIDQLLEWTYIHTYYVQSFCSRLYELDVEVIEEEHLNQIKQQIFYSYEQIFYNYRELLTFAQWQLLKAIGIEEKLVSPTGKTFLTKYGLGSHSSVKRTLTALIEKDLVTVDIDTNEEKIYSVNDVFLRRWFQYKYRN